ncbi:MAG TPA: VPDSG-CTERM sorting domain-containing protein [Verrucomicrobia bacterium]|nr:VPDSG-CTERM sorting domain-containing protein [Verrucomicrobiota bacterium]HOP96776.1 VPDSG-CTERM sorting domain-containing protein [Verrucomicrobiota bacterium]HPU57164.1 VPDSG-CTERM sorting domain-containing protein [Verrucomicrobiota bacterium]
MKTTIFSALAAGVLLLGGASASAIPYAHDYEVFSIEQSLVEYLSKDGRATYSGSFNILDQGFDPECMEIFKVELKFRFKDDSSSDGKEKVTITLDSSPLVSSLELTSGGWTTVARTYTSGTILDLLSDGILNYTVTAEKGDFKLKEAKLYVKAKRTCVPDNGTTLVLLGTGLVTLVGLQRRFAA